MCIINQWENKNYKLVEKNNLKLKEIIAAKEMFLVCL